MNFVMFFDKLADMIEDLFAYVKPFVRICSVL